MSTRTIQINCNTRPVRLAFLVDKPDPSTLEKVFELNTLLWGGILNPLVILDGSTRKQVGRHYAFEDSKYDQEQLQLLKAFDPDILVNYSGAELPTFLAPFKYRTFPVGVMRWNPFGTQEVMAFLEVWPFLQQHWRKEIRFLQKPVEKYGYFDLEGSENLRTLIVAQFGKYSVESNGNTVLANNFGGKRISYDEDFRRSFSLDEWVFPIHLTSLQLEILRPSTHNTYIFFLLDPENMFDIVDYWNLRAAGFRVFPLPMNRYQDFSVAAKDFAERSVYPINQSIETNAEIVKGRSIEDSQLDEAGKWLSSTGFKGQLSLRGWVPRFRDSGPDRRVSPEMRIRPVISVESSEVVVFDDGHGTLRLSPPDCDLRGPYYSQHWAVDLQPFGTTGEGRTFRLPWLHPECDALASRMAGREFGPYASRVSKNGIAVMQHGDRNNLWIEEPKVTAVLRAYLKDGGFDYLKTSTPGLTLERIVEQLGGLLPCTVFQNSGVRELVEKLADGSRTPANNVYRIICKSIPSGEVDRQQIFKSILSRLVDAKVLRQGFELQCKRCQRHDWYHLSELSEDFRCKKCFHTQQVPNLDGKPWFYVSDGLFRLEGKVAGSLTTVLSLLFLEHFVSHDVTYVPSFDYADGAIQGERDFALFATDFLGGGLDVVIGECKSLQEMKENQREAIMRLGEKTGAYLAFSTLSDEFTSDDKLFFEHLVVAGQKPILLTRKHLEMPYLEIGEYRRDLHWLGRRAELLFRLTIKEVLGDEFVKKHWLQT